MSLIGIDVKGIQVIKSPGVDDFPILRLMGGIKFELRSFPVVNGMKGHSYVGISCGSMCSCLAPMGTWGRYWEWGEISLLLGACLSVRECVYVYCKCGVCWGEELTC